ncbi:glycosyltransferase involved in cell wall biosynthesis [Kordia periserrulae]|uniref:Glycosyltransferase involved in cell wall biosynthesis n=1 Tax=Kordia periserrulae TaxID=701523 RepID=A0A2T6BZL5_9FLAO|nr:glycosyltransferase [Kordia periserrulae]PTX61498.1 glycosyltransferase involved in cell wall biosynthesis [Kordia periserrulae]
MNVLFLVNNTKISPNANGGASVYFSHLQLLAKLNYKVHVLLVDFQDGKKARLSSEVNSEYIQEIDGLYKEIQHFQVAQIHPKGMFNRIKTALFQPEKFEYFFVNSTNEEILKQYISKNNINLVWAEWRWTAILANYSKLNIPILYAHHDWEFKLRKLKSKLSFIQKFHLKQKKRVELNVVKSVYACVSASYTETQEIKDYGNKNALYIPLTYKKVELTKNDAKTPSIVHLGGMGTTANRIGLERFLEVCWKDLKEQIPNVTLKVIGNLKYASESLKKRLEDEQIQCLGFIENLQSELKPYDLHIIPWEYNTGTRTRIPLVFNYAQVLVSTKAAASCYPEIVHNQNSILCNDLSQMTTQLIDLYNNAEKRIFIGDNARKTFEENFTVEEQVEKLKKFFEMLNFE